MTDFNYKIFETLKDIERHLGRLAPNEPWIKIEEDTNAYLWNKEHQILQKIKDIHAIPYPLLQGIDAQKKILMANTRQFANGYPANNALLWGAKGMGKSSIVKAIHAVISEEQKTIDHPEKLCLIEIHREDLEDIPKLLSALRHEKRRFILYCDDLSFDGDDTRYKSLKAILEGGLESRPENILFYATSNRRHLLSREMIENEQVNAIHGAETIDEKVSLSDRFGIWLGFHQCTEKQWEDMILSYARAFKIDETEASLLRLANEWSVTRGAKSGRVAWQFITDLRGKQAMKNQPAR